MKMTTDRAQQHNSTSHHPPGLIWSLFGRKKIKLLNIFYVKETVQVVPENTYKTHRVNPSSVTSVSSVGTMVMFLSLDLFMTFSSQNQLGPCNTLTNR